MSTFSIRNVPTGTQSWFITLYPAGAMPILPKATLALSASAQLDAPTGTYPRILVIAYASAPGAAEAVLDVKELKNQSISDVSGYIFDWTTGKFS